MRDFFATCPKGLEYLLVDELKALGASDVHEALSGVYFSGELEAGYRACLWSRLASRILMPISEFAVENGDQLYEGAKTIDWTEHFQADATFAIDAVGSTTASRTVNTRHFASRTRSSISCAKKWRAAECRYANAGSAHQSRAAQRQCDRKHRSVRRAAASARLPQRHGAGAAERKSCLRDAVARRLAGDLFVLRRHRRSAVRLRHAAHRGRHDGRRCGARICGANDSDSPAGKVTMPHCGKCCMTMRKRAHRPVCSNCDRYFSDSIRIRLC